MIKYKCFLNKYSDSNSYNYKNAIIHNSKYVILNLFYDQIDNGALENTKTMLFVLILCCQDCRNVVDLMKLRTISSCNKTAPFYDILVYFWKSSLCITCGISCCAFHAVRLAYQIHLPFLISILIWRKATWCIKLGVQDLHIIPIWIIIFIRWRWLHFNGKMLLKVQNCVCHSMNREH